MSGGQWKRHDGFNKTQIKDGKIVIMRKDGRIRSVLGPLKKGKKK